MWKLTAIGDTAFEIKEGSFCETIPYKVVRRAKFNGTTASFLVPSTSGLSWLSLDMNEDNFKRINEPIKNWLKWRQKHEKSK